MIALLTPEQKVLRITSTRPQMAGQQHNYTQHVTVPSPDPSLTLVLVLQLDILPSFFSASSSLVKNSTMEPGMADSTTFLGSIPLMSGWIKLTNLHLFGSL